MTKKFRTIILAAAVLAASPAFADGQRAAPQTGAPQTGDVYVVVGGQQPSADIQKQLGEKGYGLRAGIPTDAGCKKIQVGKEFRLRCPNSWVKR